MNPAIDAVLRSLQPPEIIALSDLTWSKTAWLRNCQTSWNIIEYESCCRVWKSKILQLIYQFPSWYFLLQAISNCHIWFQKAMDSSRQPAPPTGSTTCDDLCLRLLQLQGRSGLHAYLPPLKSFKSCLHSIISIHYSPLDLWRFGPFHVSPYLSPTTWLWLK